MGNARETMLEFQRMADRLCVLIRSSDLPEVDIEIEKAKVRERCLQLYPDREQLFLPSPRPTNSTPSSPTTGSKPTPSIARTSPVKGKKSGKRRSGEVWLALQRTAAGGMVGRTFTFMTVMCLTTLTPKPRT